MMIDDSSVPPINLITPLDWLKKNLFSTWNNSLLTLVSLLFIYWLGSGFIHWFFTQAQWEVIQANLRLFFVGRYPQNLLWRPWFCLGIIVSLSGLSWGIMAQSSQLFSRKILVIFAIVSATFVALVIPASPSSTWLLLGMLILLIFGAFAGKKSGQFYPVLKSWLIGIWGIAFLVIIGLLQGGLFLKPVRLDEFSGLILTLFVALVSIILSFPFGILLALGRQSDLPVIRWLSIAYIELIRGLPLIGILFMAQVMLPLVLPIDLRVDRVLRGIAGFTFFSAAYLAENVRGGLQSIPRGQLEAAKALGLNSPLRLILIILPQALKAVIPAIVGQFISLFKDTSLLAIVGLVDLLGIAQSILANPKFLGSYIEVYLFIAFIYWICCSAMSWASRKLEQKG
jgi:general L-amino acid transport system permease protein